MDDIYEHLGDGAYVKYDGFCTWLLANDHKNPTDKVCLEPQVLINLLRFLKTNKVLSKFQLKGLLQPDE